MSATPILSTAVPSVSVVVTSFNRPESLRVTLQSLTRQGRAIYEVIVCDDASKPAVDNLVRVYEGHLPRLTFMGAGSTMGMPRNLNRGILKSSGSHILTLHDGDWYSEGSIARLRNALWTNQSAGLAFTGIRSHSPGGEFRDVRENLEFLTTGADFLQFVLSRRGYDSPVWGSAMFSARVLQQIGLPDPAFGAIADVDYWLRIASQFDVVYLGDPLLNLPGREVVKSNWEDSPISNKISGSAAFIAADLRRSAARGSSLTTVLARHTTRFFINSWRLRLLLYRRRFRQNLRKAT